MPRSGTSPVIGRKIEQARARRRHRLCAASSCVGLEMIPDAHLPGAELRDQHLVEKGQTDGASGDACDGPSGHHSLPPQGAKPREVTAPMDRLRRVGALAPGGTRLGACPGLLAPGLVKKEPVVGGYLVQDVEQGHALLLHGGALWRDGAERCFGEAS